MSRSFRNVLVGLALLELVLGAGGQFRIEQFGSKAPGHEIAGDMPQYERHTVSRPFYRRAPSVSGFTILGLGCEKRLGLLDNLQYAGAKRAAGPMRWRSWGNA